MPVLPFITALLPLITLLIATIARFAIKIFLQIFQWATEIFFGQISTEKNIKLMCLAILSMIWIILLFSIPFPQIAKVTLAFLPEIVRTNVVVIYLVNGLGVLFLPFIVGTISLVWDMGKSDFLKLKLKKVRYKRLLLGFYYSFFLGVSFIAMFIFSPIIKLIGFFKKEKLFLITAVVQEQRFETVLTKIQKVLKDNNIQVEIAEYNFMYKIPLRLLQDLSDSLFKDILSKNRLFLSSKELNIYIQKNDIMIISKDMLGKKVKTLIVKELIFDTTYLTLNNKTQQLERDLLDVYFKFVSSCNSFSDKLIESLEKIKSELENITVDYEEIQVIDLKILKLENEILLKKK